MSRRKCVYSCTVVGGLLFSPHEWSRLDDFWPTAEERTAKEHENMRTRYLIWIGWCGRGPRLDRNRVEFLVYETVPLTQSQYSYSERNEINYLNIHISIDF